MKATDRLGLIDEVRDLQIIDVDGCNCGIVDDVELDGAAGGELVIAAVLVGPGAYASRLPRWAMWLVRRVAGDGCVRVPWDEVESITNILCLRRRAAELGLACAEGAALRLLPRVGGG